MARKMVEVENMNHPGQVKLVDAAMYDAMRRAFLKLLPKTPPGLTVEEIYGKVVTQLPKDLFPGVLATVILTEGLTAAGILALLPMPLELVFVLLPVIGIGLNGTSSVLYGTAPELVSREARTRAFGVFYTGTAGASAVAPPIMGLFGDRFGVPSTMAGIAIGVLATIPLAVILNPILARAEAR